MRPILYVASRASMPARVALWKNLRQMGARIISTWIDEAGPNQTEDFTKLWFRIESEISRCERLILYVEADDFPLKGALVEVGMALAMRKDVWVLGYNVQLEGRTDRPLGSWIRHPRVERIKLDCHIEDLCEACGV